MENKILDHILGENFHSEVFRRSYTIFKFLLEIGHTIKLLGIINFFKESILKAIEYDEAVIFQMIVDLSKHF